MRAIAWIAAAERTPRCPAPGQVRAGEWGSPESLNLPLGDRALQLADGLFETLCVEAGQPHLLSEHLERWQSSAGLLGMEQPPERQEVELLLAEAIQRSDIRDGALRLNWGRGHGPATGRGINLPAADEPAPPHRFWLQFDAATPCFEPVSVLVSGSEQRNANSLQSRCKTFAYGASIQARREARAAGADDALLLSTAGGLCCGSTANLLVHHGERWRTPAAASGCLPGVMRGRALSLGLAEEAWINPADLDRDLASGQGLEGAAVLINSLSCRAIVNLNGFARPQWLDVEPLWRSLLSAPRPLP